MDTPKNFRSALNGFNREDVVRYIEYINAKHAAQLNECSAEVEFLRSKLAAAQAVPAQDPAVLEQLNAALQQVSQLEARCAALEQEREDRCAALACERDEALAARAQAEAARDAALTRQSDKSREEALERRCTQLEAQLAEALAAKAKAEGAVQCHESKELEAYRRAERTERVARERAEQVYNKVNGVLAEATVTVDEAAGQIGGMSDQVLAQLKVLESAISGSKQALEDAAATLYAIRPQAED